MLKVLRPLTTDPQLSERMIAKALAKSREALLEYFLAVRDEQKPRTRQDLAKPCVVNRSHHRLPGAGRRDQQVSVMPERPRKRDLL